MGPDSNSFCYSKAGGRQVEPDNAAVREEIERVRELRARGEPSLPSTIGHERRINPFLRVNDPAVVVAVQRQSGIGSSDGGEVFAALRRWKDGFRAPVSP